MYLFAGYSFITHNSLQEISMYLNQANNEIKNSIITVDDLLYFNNIIKNRGK